jgi:hypothetical protein
LLRDVFTSLIISLLKTQLNAFGLTSLAFNNIFAIPSF